MTATKVFSFLRALPELERHGRMAQDMQRRKASLYDGNGSYGLRRGMEIIANVASGREGCGAIQGSVIY